KTEMSLKCVLLSFGLLSAVAASILPGQATWSERVVNGDSIDILQAPWQITLLKGPYLSHGCGGAIVSSRIILTAAHCLWGLLPENLSVRAGSRYWNHDGQFMLVENFTIHENYLISGIFDIGVVLLAKPLAFGTKVQPIALAQKSPKHGDLAFVSGWGQLVFEGPVQPAELQGTYTPILDHRTCGVIFSRLNIIVPEDIICTYSSDRGAIFGDSGGPLVANGHLVGIVSGGYGAKYPVMYANVAYLYNWIQETARNLENHQK
ncbi:hypothetical protein KR222_000251, partial [Zaprionus bogoriensis]